MNWKPERDFNIFVEKFNRLQGILFLFLFLFIFIFLGLFKLYDISLIFYLIIFIVAVICMFFSYLNMVFLAIIRLLTQIEENTRKR